MSDQREALHEIGGMDPISPVAPKWTGGVPANLPAAAKDADLWLEFLQRGRALTSHDAEKLAACRAALREHCQVLGPSGRGSGLGDVM